MTIYFISGLGADERVFQKLVLPQSWHLVYLQWIEPLPDESLSAYAKRMSAQIKTDKAFVLIGLSFGGMIAVEMSSFLQPKLIILISSVATKHELPPSFKALGKMGIDKVVPSSLLKTITPYTYWIFGSSTTEEKKLLKQIIDDTSPPFLKWAIHRIINWQQEHPPANMVHIHGTDDRIFPARYTKAHMTIKDAGHLMVYSQAGIISHLLVEKINQCLKG